VELLVSCLLAQSLCHGQTDLDRGLVVPLLAFGLQVSGLHSSIVAHLIINLPVLTVMAQYHMMRHTHC